jgi:dTDP-4-dehydrorhamnose reductase
MRNILVTGCDGQLGSEFKDLEENYSELNFFFKDIELDVSNKLSVENFIVNCNIHIIINTAAYTNVNNAEIEKKKADLVNVESVKNLVELSEKYKCKLIHYSTDYVYEGLSIKPINESTLTNPKNYYGKSKRKGELFIENSFSESIVIRTSWLYSYYGKNFVNTIVEKANKGNELPVVNDQFGCPTYAKDLALDTINILESNMKLDNNGKIFNYSNLGSTNWSGLAIKVVEILSLDCKIKEVKTEFFKSNVKRPKYSITSKNKIINTFNLNIPKWEDSLKIYLTNFKK